VALRARPHPVRGGRPGAPGPLIVLWTVGYEGFPTPAELIEALEARGIEWVCDVRALPQSRRRGFSRTALRDALADRGIVYEHRGELGNPAPLREVYRSGDLAGGREGYREHLLAGPAWALDALADRAAERPTAMLCLEDDPRRCHRDVIAEELVRRHPGIEVRRIAAGGEGGES
jgi:uncharacterized protein (DUF488 family)